VPPTQWKSNAEFCPLSSGILPRHLTERLEPSA